MKKFVFSFVIVLVLYSSVSFAAPEPALVQSPSDWTFDVKYEPIQSIRLSVPGYDKPQRYWYTILTVTNDTGKDVDFFPRCDLMTDTFQIITCDMGVQKVVYDRIKQRHIIKYPFLESIRETSRRLLQGDNNTKDIAVVWKDFDSRARDVSVFISGLSNETAMVLHPVAKDDDGNAKRVYLRKTLKLDYGVTGDAKFRDDAKVLFEGKSWVMR